MSVRRISHRPDSLIVHLVAVLDPPVESFLRSIRLVNIGRDPALHECTSVINGRVDDTVLDGLGYDVFGVFFRVEVKFHADVGERDARIREGNRTKGGFDDKMAEAEDEEMGRIGLEGGLMGGEGCLKRRNVANTNGYNGSHQDIQQW